MLFSHSDCGGVCGGRWALLPPHALTRLSNEENMTGTHEIVFVFAYRKLAIKSATKLFIIIEFSQKN